MPFWHCRFVGGSVDLPPTALLASLTESWDLAVGPGIKAGRAVAAGYYGLGDAEGGG